MHIHIYITNFFCRNSHFWKMCFAISWISQVTLFAAVSLFRGNRETIFSHKINLKLFQKQYNSLIKKAFLMFPIYKRSKDHGRVERTQQPPSTTRQLCTVTLIVSLFAQQYFVCLLFCNTILYKSLACIPKNF